MSQKKKLTKKNMHEIMKELGKERPVFHSEADFQHALAWKIHEEYPDYNVRLEKREVVNDKEVYFDIFIFKNNEKIPIEVKYKTRELKVSIENEEYKLKTHSAYPPNRYEFIKDISRLEAFGGGFAVFLTNDSLYWYRGEEEGIDEDFKIYENRKIKETLNWGPKAGNGTTKGKGEITLLHSYIFHWTDYSEIKDCSSPNGSKFRYLLVEIPKVTPNKADTGNSVKLIPDWQTPKAVVLVWPEEVYRKYLTSFYARLSAYIPENIKLIYLIKDKGIEKEVTSSVRKYNPKISVDFIVIPEIADIWIRDWAPIPAVDVNGKAVLVKALYWPRYLVSSKTYREKAKGDDTAGRRLLEHLKLPVVDIPLIWDIGNLTHNGRGTAIVTKRLIDDNRENYTENEIKSSLKNKLNITDLIILPEEPEDDTGHIDGMVRFIDEKTLAVGSYPEDWPGGKEFMDSIAEKLRKELGEGYRIIRVPNGIPSDEKSEGMASAVGNHMNFLRLGNKLLLPYYGIPEDEIAREVLQNALPGIEVIPVDIPGIKKLASKGGVLNCITWCYF